MKSERWIEEELAELQKKHLFRTLTALPSGGGVTQWQGREYLNFSSNDYLNLLHRAELKQAVNGAVEKYGTGSGASRLVTGNLAIHEQLETEIARHKGYPAGLLFGSGFLANLGVITAMAGREDMIFADRLVHASIIDAIRLCGASLVRFQHNDMTHLGDCLEKAGGLGRKLIITESVFSMDGDSAPLAEIAALSSKYGTMLMIDEAHATGVYGPRGSGLVCQHQLQDKVNISMSTMSKGLGGYGGAIACSELMRDWLINKARALIYTTSLPPGVCASALAALAILENEPDLGTTLLNRAKSFRSALQKKGFNTGLSESQIIPVMIGENETALKLAAAMREQGIIVTAIRPPTVPKGTARLRFSVTLAHNEALLIHTASILKDCAEKIGL